jgi:hypothetical protein
MGRASHRLNTCQLVTVVPLSTSKNPKHVIDSGAHRADGASNDTVSTTSPYANSRAASRDIE